MRSIIRAASAIALSLAVGFASAQTFPTKPIRVLIGFPPGGGIDVVARMLAPRLSESLGQQVVVDNRAGASGIIALGIAARSAADGYTLFFGTKGNLSVNPTLYPDTPFSIPRDFAPLTQVASVSALIYVHPSIPPRTLGELIAYAKANPGKVHFSSSGNGGFSHLGGELLNNLAGIRTVHVPYKGTTPAFTALLGAEVQYAVNVVVSGLPHLKAGRLRAVATTTQKRLALLPAVPAAGEALRGFEVDNWYGMVLPAATPRDVVGRLHAEIVKSAGAPDIRDKLAVQGIEIVNSSPQEFGAFMKAEILKWARVIKSANIRAD